MYDFELHFNIVCKSRLYSIKLNSRLSTQSIIMIHFCLYSSRYIINFKSIFCSSFNLRTFEWTKLNRKCGTEILIMLNTTTFCLVLIHISVQGVARFPVVFKLKQVNFASYNVFSVFTFEVNLGKKLPKI